MAAKTRKINEDIMFDLFKDYPNDDVNGNVFVRSLMKSASLHAPDDGAGGAADSAPEAPVVSKKAKIEDFGEKIGGARKDLYSVYRDLLSYSAMMDVEKVPFSKSWPKPNYEKLLENGVDPWRVDAIRALRDVVSHVPRNRRYKWTFNHLCVAFREYAINIINNEYDNLEDVHKALMDDTSNDGLGIHSSYRQEFMQLADMYSQLGHSEDIPQFKIYHYSRYYPSYGQESIENVYVANFVQGYSSLSKDICYASTEEETLSLLIDHIKQNRAKDAASISGSSKEKRKSKLEFHVYRYSGAFEAEYHICCKVGKNVIKVKGPFSDRDAAFEYRSSHEEELAEIFAAMKNLPSERGTENQPRAGEAYRQGDVSPDDFLKTFGFHGVEFGNYVEGGRRQKDLNDAYDALMDLSKVTNLPPRALSLGGKLGLAFGARGHGGKQPALAHYEPMKTVINLTKKRGAGSLAHEWFHALDNALAREHGKGQARYLSDDFGRISHEELFNALRDLKYTLKRDTDFVRRSEKLDKFRTKPYWGTTVEYMARSFEAYAMAKLSDMGIKNDYLVNILDGESWESKTNAPYAYPTKAEMETILPYYDKLFDSIQQRVEDENIVLYSASADITVKSLDAKRVPYDKLTPDELGLHAFGEQVLGIQTAFYDDDPKLHGHFDTSTSTIYLNRSSECELPWVFAHEAFHAMKEADPALYKEIMELAGGVESFSKEKMDAYREDRQKPDLPDDIVRQEMLADAFADYSTGRRAILEMAGKEPHTIRRALNFLHRAMDDLKSMFFGEKRKDTERKYPNVAISKDQFHNLSRGFEALQEELRYQQHLTKGQDMFLSMLAEVPNFKHMIHSPYAFYPDKQFMIDCKAMEAMSSLYPELSKENIASAVAHLSPCGALRYEDRLLSVHRNLDFNR